MKLLTYVAPKFSAHQLELLSKRASEQAQYPSRHNEFFLTALANAYRLTSEGFTRADVDYKFYMNQRF